MNERKRGEGSHEDAFLGSAGSQPGFLNYTALSKLWEGRMGATRRYKGDPQRKARGDHKQAPELEQSRI